MLHQGGADVPIGAIKVFFSPADLATNLSGAFSVFAGNYTYGNKVYFTQAGAVLGVKFWWAPAGDTVKVSLWNSSGTRLASATGAVSGASENTITFSSSVVINQTNLYQPYYVSIWGTTVASYSFASSASLASFGYAGPIANFLLAPYYMLANGSFSPTQTDSWNSTGDNSDLYAVEPVYAPN